MSRLKCCDLLGETFKGFEVVQFSTSAKTTQLLSSGEFCKLRCDTIPVKSASANVSFYTNNSKIPNFELWHSCRKWAMCVIKWIQNTDGLNVEVGWEKRVFRILEVPVSNLQQKAGSSDLSKNSFKWQEVKFCSVLNNVFFHSLKANSGIVPWFEAKTVNSTILPIHYSLIILCSLYKIHKKNLGIFRGVQIPGRQVGRATIFCTKMLNVLGRQYGPWIIPSLWRLQFWRCS